MSKQLRIVITERAELDLDEIGDYIAQQADEERAEAVLRTIAQKIQLHANTPFLGQSRNELLEGMRSFTVYRYIVFYRPLEEGIRVIRVLHGSRDLETQNYSNDRE
jgi:toxin ParE1/3/4